MKNRWASCRVSPRTRRAAILAAAGVALAATLRPAAATQWLPTTTGTFSWATGTNWQGGLAPNSTTATANLSVPLSGAQTVVVDGQAVASLSLGDTNGTYVQTLRGTIHIVNNIASVNGITLGNTTTGGVVITANGLHSSSVISAPVHVVGGSGAFFNIVSSGSGIVDTLEFTSGFLAPNLATNVNNINLILDSAISTSSIFLSNTSSLTTNAANLLPSTSELDSEGAFNLNGHNQSVSGLTGGGTTNLAGATLSLAQDVTSYFDGTITGAGSVVVNNGAGFTLAGSVTNNSLITTASSLTSSTTIHVGIFYAPGDRTATLLGTGTLTLTNSQFASIVGQFGNETLTNTASHTITGSGSISALTLLNQGTISASNGYLTLSNLLLTNTGILGAATVGTLNLSSITINNQSGTIQSLNNSAVLASNVTFQGGTLTSSGSGYFYLSGVYNILDGASHGPIVTSAAIYLDSASSAFAQITGTVTNNASILLNPNTSLLIAGHLIGNGTLSVSANASVSLLDSAPLLSTSPLLRVSALTIASSNGSYTGGVDLTYNPLIVDPAAADRASTLTALQNEIAYGNSHDAGIFSSTRATLYGNLTLVLIDNASANLPFFRFAYIDANAFLVVPTYPGDANLDGHVDLNDLNTVLNNLGTTTSLWTNGNFDGAATIDLNDLNAVLNHLGLTFGNSSSVAAGPLFPDSAPAPEPASLAFLALFPLIPLLHRRRRA